MKRRQYSLMLLLALLAGLICGLISGHVIQPVFAEKETGKIIEANEFRLVDADKNSFVRLWLGDRHLFVWLFSYIKTYH